MQALAAMLLDKTPTLFIASFVDENRHNKDMCYVLEIGLHIVLKKNNHYRFDC